MRYGFINNFSQALAADLAAGATSMTLDGGGSLLTGVSATTPYRLTLIEKDGDGVEIGYEIVDVTAVSTNDLTISRAKEGTSDQAWTTGATVECRITAAVAGLFLQNDDRIIWGDATTGNPPVAGVVMLAYDGYATCDVPQVTIGDTVYNYGTKGISIGFNTNVQGDGAIAIGDNISAALHGICLSAGDGSFAGTYDEKCIALGYRVGANGAFSQAYGAQAEPYVAGGMLTNAIPYLESVPPTPLTNQPQASVLCASQAVLALNDLDLTTAGAVQTLGLPGSCRLFIDSIEAIVTSSSAPSGTPQIKVGTDATNTDNLLAASAVTATALHGRQVFSPATTEGVTDVRVEVVTAGSGTWEIRLAVRGYVLEV